jgi:hypothetical protein
MFGGVQLRAPASSRDYRRRRPPERRARKALALILSKVLRRPIRIDAWRFASPRGIRFVIAGGAGEVFTQGETKVRPGVYVRVTDVGAAEQVLLPRGVVGTILRSTWGPLNTATEVFSAADGHARFGTGGTTGVLDEIFNGGAASAKVVRVGTGGTAATKQLTATAVNRVLLTAKYVGARGAAFAVTKRVNPNNAAQNQLLLYEGTVLLETITYTPSPDDATALVAAVTAESEYLTATLNAAGAIDTYTASAFTGGTDPTVDGAAYITALGVVETQNFNVLATDTEDTAIHASIASWLNRVRSEGKRVLAVIGEPTGVAEATRRANAAAFNNAALVYVGNGFVYGGANKQGYVAAGRVAGMIAGAALT